MIVALFVVEIYEPQTLDMRQFSIVTIATIKCSKPQSVLNVLKYYYLSFRKFSS